MIRRIVNEKLQDVIKLVFKEVCVLSVSLKKITIDSVSYTVIVMFFFLNSELKVFMNDL